MEPPPAEGRRIFTRSALGGADRDRTGDLLLAKQALSQLSYGPVRNTRPKGVGVSYARPNARTKDGLAIRGPDGAKDGGPGKT